MSESPETEPEAEINTEYEAHADAEDQGFSRAFWRTLIALLLVIGGLEMYGALYLDEIAPELKGEPQDLVTESTPEASEAPAETTHRAWREELIKESFSAARRDYAELGAKVKEDAKRELKIARVELIKQVPAWADWYYSVIGEYVRLGHLGAQAAGQGDFSDYMLEQLSERVFKPARVSERLAHINTQSQGAFAKRRGEIIAHLSETLKHHQFSERDWSDQEREALEARFQSLEQLEDLSTVSPLGIAAKLTTLTGLKLGIKAIAARSATKLGSVGIAKGAAMTGVKAGGKLGVKAGVRGGSVLATGASATAACAPIGLAAPLCGIIAATATWVAVDKAIVEIDELINRDEFEEQLKLELESMMDEIEAEVLLGLDQHQEQVFKLLFEAQERRIDTPPSSTRIADQFKAPPMISKPPASLIPQTLKRPTPTPSAGAERE